MPSNGGKVSPEDRRVLLSCMRAQHLKIFLILLDAGSNDFAFLKGDGEGEL